MAINFSSLQSESNRPLLFTKGRFREDVSDTSSSILSSHNSDDTDPDSKTCLNGFSHHLRTPSNDLNVSSFASDAKSDAINANNGNAIAGKLYMNGNGSLHNAR